MAIEATSSFTDMPHGFCFTAAHAFLLESDVRNTMSSALLLEEMSCLCCSPVGVKHRLGLLLRSAKQLEDCTVYVCRGCWKPRHAKQWWKTAADRMDAQVLAIICPFKMRQTRLGSAVSLSCR